MFILQRHGNKIFIPVNSTIIRKCKRMILYNPIDRSPNIDNLNSFLQKLWRFISSMNSHSFFAGPGSLINMNSSNRTTRRRFIGLSRNRTTNSMIENYDFMRSSDFLQQFLDFLVVSILNRLVIFEILFGGKSFDNLKSVLVECEFVFMTTNIVNWNVFGDIAVISWRFMSVHKIVWFLTVGRRGKKIQLRYNSRHCRSLCLCLC